VIDGTAFRPADADLFTTLRGICDAIRRGPAPAASTTPPQRLL
jgi:hypothetical protein